MSVHSPTARSQGELPGDSPGDRPALPELRRDLALRPAPPAPDGRERWLIHDPVAGRFHRIGERALNLLRGGADGSADVSLDEREAFARFLAKAKLTRNPLPPDALAREAAARQTTLLQLLVHKYLFFKIPLVQPQGFLDRAAPWVEFAFTRGFWVVTLLAGLVGIVLAGQQWGSFRATFVGFLSVEGAVFYGLTLLGLKVCHELGHGFAAQRFGVRVPVMGVAFMVLMPIAYTETTEASALPRRRDRVAIDAAGMAVELSIACYSLLLWSFLPDGPGRQVAFFLATTSWTLSLLVNLNPCMRFDGYYLISDLLGLTNLQSRGFGLAKWRLREALFGLGDPKPHMGEAAGLERPVLAWAYATWVYRFFLFIGIAILVHHLFPKAIGIVLFCVEILMFIALPISREVRVWLSRRADILRSPRGRRNLVVAGLGAVLLFAPLSGRISAPAQVEAARAVEVFTPAPATIAAVEVAHGARVEAGDVLLRLASDDLSQKLREAELERRMAQAELSRAEAVREFRTHLEPLRDALARAEEKITGLDALERELTVRAPIPGRVEAVGSHLHAGREVGQETALLTIRSEEVHLSARIGEADALRLLPDAQGVFVGTSRQSVRLTLLAPVAEERLTLPALASVHGGPVVVDADPQTRALTPRAPRLVAELRLDGPAREGMVGRETVGRVFLEAERRSVASLIGARVRAVLVREFDF